MNKDKFLKSFLISGIVIYIFAYLTSFIFYLVKIMYAKTLSVEDYGLFFSIIGFYSLLNIFNGIGFSETLNYYGVKFFERKKFQSLKNTLFYSILTYLISSLVFLLFVFFLIDFLSTNYFKDSDAKVLILILSLYFIFNAITQNIIALFQTKQNFFYAKLFEFIRIISVFIFSLITYFYFNSNIYYFSISWVISYVITFVIFYFIIKKEFPFLSKVSLSYDFKLYKTLFEYAIPLMLATGANFLLARIDLQMIVYYLGLYNAGIYEVAFSIAGIILLFLVPIQTLILSITAKLIENKEQSLLNMLITNVYKFYLLFGLPFLIIFVFFSKEIILLLFGQKYLEAKFAVIALAISSYLTVFATSNLQLLGGLGEVKKRTKIVYLSAILNVLGNIILIPVIGILGAAVATVLTYVLMFLLTLRESLKFIQLNISVLFLLKLFFVNILFYFTLFSLKSLISLPMYLEVFLLGTISFGVYFGLIFILKLFEINDFLKPFGIKKFDFSDLKRKLFK